MELINLLLRQNVSRTRPTMNGSGSEAYGKRLPQSAVRLVSDIVHHNHHDDDTTRLSFGASTEDYGLAPANNY